MPLLTSASPPTDNLADMSSTRQAIKSKDPENTMNSLGSRTSTGGGSLRSFMALCTFII
ncbi:uncharacterized protein BXZ73DRAFT_108343 [Epithele typhae]|uniref:uncharacterized protein n=1 Tax=Epithele typhae TaxID=378194 RepID=UPI0020072861|nr:uncharacterized protein BXZ73DRAFT_108343 [Epithele typhae]KAH9910978.1 hypothetical protein BXZ73DRAFT_108343 [Epithele typhae]